MGFGQLWCKLVSNLLSTSSTCILLNGEQGDSIQHQRGLRQGDLLSPMIFILIMDVINSIFVKAGDEGLLQPLSPRISEQCLSLYADDVALFIKPVEEELQVTRDLLMYLVQPLVYRQTFTKIASSQSNVKMVPCRL